MAKNPSSLTVQEKINAALKLIKQETPAATINISKLARLAGVSRANLYASHPELVLSLKRTPTQKSVDAKTSSPQQKLRVASAALKLERRKNKALLYLAGELRAEIERLHKRLTKNGPKKRNSSQYT